MKNLLGACAAIACLATVQTAAADEALAQANGCTACHQVGAKLVGPAYQEVAAKYQGDAGAPAMLAGKVRNGGVGTWGQIPMPPNTTISDADLEAVIAWVLAQ
jgi:cytochrome c